MAHARRKFMDILKVTKQSGIATRIVTIRGSMEEHPKVSFYISCWFFRGIERGLLESFFYYFSLKIVIFRLRRYL